MAKQLRVLSIRKETQKSDLSGQYIKEVQVCKLYHSTIKYKACHLQTNFQDINLKRAEIKIKKMKLRKVNNGAAKISKDRYSDLIFCIRWGQV